MEKIIIACISLCTLFCASYAQQNEWNDLTPNIVDRETLVRRHYQSNGFEVFDDTLSDQCCDNGTWIAIDTVVIPRGVRVRLPIDATILFEPNAVLHVDGILQIAGSVTQPVYLGPVNPNDMYIMPKDKKNVWQGIRISPEGKLYLKDVHIRGARFGIQSSGECDSLFIGGVRFSEIEDAFVKIGENYPDVKNSSNFTLRCFEHGDFSNTNHKTYVPLTGQERPGDKGKVFRYLSNSFWGTALTCAAVGAGLYIAAYNTDKKVLESKTHKDAQGYSDKATNYYTFGNYAFGGAAAAAIIGLGFRLKFNFTKK